LILAICRAFSPKRRLTKKIARRFVKPRARKNQRYPSLCHRHPVARPSGGAKEMPETTMKKTILTIFASALLAGSVTQSASANEHHRYISRAYRAAPPPVVVGAPYRDSYAAYGPYSDYDYWTSRMEGGVISAPAGH
jgi:hypothetical protein